MIYFLLGVFLGAAAGVCIMGLLLSAKLADMETQIALTEQALHPTERPMNVDIWWKDDDWDDLPTPSGDLRAN